MGRAGMKTRDFCRGFWRDQRGAFAVMFVVLLPVLIGFSALAIDMSYAYWTRTQLQHAASAAALAGVLDIDDTLPPFGVPDNDAYRNSAVEIAYTNMSSLGSHGNILDPSCGSFDGTTVFPGSECADVKAGDWNPDTRTFTPWDGAGFDLLLMELNAVKVKARRAEANGNPLKYFLAPVVALAESDINVSAVAWADDDSPLDCYQRGIISNQWVDLDSNNDYTEVICVYGEL